MIVRLAGLADIAFVMQTERLPGYETTVGQWDAQGHAAEWARPDSAYLIAEEDGAPVAFAILQCLDDAGGNIYLKRFAVVRQGEGIGARALRLILDWVFALPSAHRFYLHYSERNDRGRRLYARCGFQTEGVEREVFKLADGARVNSVRVSLLRHEWDALQQ